MAQPTHMGASAHILFHPNAIAAPIVQQRRAGRYPKEIVNIRAYAREKSRVDYKRLQETKAELVHPVLPITKELEEQRDFVASLEGMLINAKHRLAVLTQVSGERCRLVGV
jgi:hypothetical protein